MGGAPRFPGFEILGELGRGGMGVVYRAQDLRRDDVVALKTLSLTDAGALYRFKQEFRAFADVSHRNLVSLYELRSDGATWFFTMECVEGAPLLDWVGGDVARLRDALGQLAEGLAALHAAGKIHRDVKPSNVLVTPAGRLVLLDFGLAAELEAEARLSAHSEVLGTVEYMAPEQAAGRPLTAAADWYAVGTVLYEALTGRLPFPEHGIQGLIAKQTREPPPPSEARPDVPPDLDALCVALLRKDPATRAGAAEVLACAASRPSSPSTPAPTSRPGLLGRERHVHVLREALSSVQRGTTVVVWVHGRSGMGKTALVDHFLADLREEREVAVFSGRCYERESVPYKAFDALMDEVSRYLARLPSAQADALLPRDVAAAARLFPVLRRCEAIDASVTRLRGELPDPVEARRRGFTAIRELLGRMGDRRPTVLALDDLQWGDPDSALLWSEILRAPDPPRLLILGSYRSEDRSGSPFLAAVLAEHGDGAAHIPLAVEELTPAEAESLALGLLGGGDEAAVLRARAIAREAHGGPFFVQELARSAGAGELASPGAALPTLEGLIAARVAALEDEVQRLLEVVCVSGRPIASAVACAAASIGARERLATSALRQGRFVRVATVEGAETYDTYHDRIRETVLGGLSPERRAAHHAAIARSLLASGDADPEVVATHLQGAGDLETAGLHFERAAEIAAGALAFDRAALAYRTALELRPTAGEARAATLCRLAEVLMSARRGAEAAEAYLEASRCGVPEKSLERRRLAGEQLYLSGRLDEAAAVLGDVVRAARLVPPASRRRILASIVLRRAWRRLRGLGYRERAASELSAGDLLRVDTCWALGRGYSNTDTLRGTYFMTRHLGLALRLGEPSRVARALVMEAALGTYGGTRTTERRREILRRADEVLPRSTDPYVPALRAWTEAAGEFLSGRWATSRPLCERADAVLRELGRGNAWERHVVNFFALRALDYLGRFDQIAAEYPDYLRDAEARGDRFAATDFRARLGHLPPLCRDEPDLAMQEPLEAVRGWSREGFHLQHYYALLASVEVLLYRGDVAGAWQLVEAEWPAFRRSLIMRLQLSHVSGHACRARVAAARAASADPREAAALRKIARRHLARVDRDDVDYGRGWSALVRAALAAQEGARDPALAHLADAEAHFERADMQAYLAVARRRRGELRGGDEGRTLVDAADARLRSAGVLRPDRWADMYAPGFPR